MQKKLNPQTDNGAGRENKNVQDRGPFSAEQGPGPATLLSRGSAGRGNKKISDRKSFSQDIADGSSLSAEGAQVGHPNSDPLPPPEYLSPYAASVWRRTVAHLVAHGRLDIADEPTIETYVAAVERQRLIAVEIASGPMVTGGKISPLLRVAEATAATVRNLGHVLGLNPVARQRLPRPPQQAANDKWAGILK